jgi:hypothetical protein
MLWFLERISAKTLPISFGIKDRREHPEGFAKLDPKNVAEEYLVLYRTMLGE